MSYLKEFNNGLKLVVTEMPGAFSVSCGILVKTGSINETEKENGISHFIEHTMFKGTEKRSAYDISRFIDGIGAQINAYTSKEMTCYYTKSTIEHTEDSLEVLSDIFFHSTFDRAELNKEKGVIIEEINMSEDSPEDLCLDLLAESFYGKEGLGRTILGSAKNVRSFTKKDVSAYMDKYYTADNVVISVAGNVKVKEITELCERYFVNEFTRLSSAKQWQGENSTPQNLKKIKKIEQSHIAICMPAINLFDKRVDALSIANVALGGGMSSRLFQKVREELGLCYTVYSYVSTYKNAGVTEIYAGVNTESRDVAAQAIFDEVKKFKKNGITEEEFRRGKEQIKSAFIFGQESNSALMQLYGRRVLFTGEILDVRERIKRIDSVTEKDVAEVIEEFFDLSKASTATIGPKRAALKI